MQKNLFVKLLLIVLLLAGFGFALTQKDIRLGKDLRGGTSLIYQVAMEDIPAGQRQDVLEQVIRVLQNRVNPQGVLDISMQPLGDDRIEIVMPLPSPEVQALRADYERQLNALVGEAQIPAPQLDAALRENRAVERFGGDPESDRGRLVRDVQEAYNDLIGSREQLSEAREAADEDRIAMAETAVAEAMIRYDDLRAAVLRMSLDRGRIERVLALPAQAERARGAAADAPHQPSPRDIELINLKADFPRLRDAIERTVAAYDEYQARRTGLDDPEDLKRLLRGAGVLDYRIAVRQSAPQGVNIEDLRQQLRERGPENTDSPVARWFEINNLRQWYETPEQLAFLQENPEDFFATRDLVAAQRDGRYYLMLYTTQAKSITHGQHGEARWSVTRAFQDQDQQGRPAVGFRLDPQGGRYMSRLTGQHLGEPMAIVLDNQVYSAPTLQGQISTSGIITGRFSQADIRYLTQVLNAGALEARLSEHPIAENNLGPSIGADNLRRGMEAFMVALIAVAVFMILYYFVAGVVAVFALAANGLIIFGVMAGLDGTFTLPGLAGIVLTIGMAVDANVLIYERIREEMFSGEWDLRGAIRQGYAKALSTIMDANITNLIVCVVLFNYATTEVKGFALTLTIGIAATLFTALFVTRQIYLLYTDIFKKRTLPMLPTVFPAIHHFLEPNINWVGMRKAFWTVSGIALLASVALVGMRGVELFDTELRGGVAVTMRTALIDETDAGATGERHWLPHVVGEDSVETRVRRIAQKADPATATDAERQRHLVLQEFARASVLTVGETRMEGGRVVGQSFQIKLPNPRGIDDVVTATDVVVEAVINEFGDLLDVAPPLRFAGYQSADHTAHTYPIESDELGANIGDPRFTERVTDFLGGVAVVVRDIEPTVSIDEVRSRIDRMRNQPDFVQARGRSVDVIGLQPADTPGEFRSVAIVVSDPNISILRTDPMIWDRQVAQVEWRLISEALAQPPSLEQVASYSAAVARSLAAAAWVAVLLSLGGILLYIWVRFGSLRYSAAAVAALVHDVTIALGLLALTAYIGRTWLGDLLLIDEFRIDLGVVAALLTIIGYSLNDTIVVLDRIRENRGKLPLPTAATVNRSINQTISRTVLTSTTTLMAIAIMYIAGGTGIRPFAFCLLIGLMVGTYSSIAIAAPLVYTRGGRQPEGTEEESEKPFGVEPEPA